MKPTVLELSDVHFSYRVHGQSVPALRGISLSIRQGEMVAIQGPSGSGKSTLLYLLGCMLKPDRGTVRILGEDIAAFDDRQLAFLRNRKLGFVFQQFHLLPSRNVLQNILLPTIYPLEVEPEMDAEEAEERARRLAEKVGLTDRLDHKPHQLSGGQQQRVAVARALIRDAPIILADEPTGNLDSKSSTDILNLLKTLNREGKTVVIITHDSEVAAQCSRTVWVRDGRIDADDLAKPVSPAVEANKVELPELKSIGIKSLMRESWPQALDNLWRNRARSLLTMMGVVVGVASVLSMLTLGEFTKKKILQSYATLGVNTLAFSAYPNWAAKATDIKGPKYYSLSLERDVAPLLSVFDEIEKIAPSYTDGMYTAFFGGRAIENEIMISGVNEQNFAITGREMALGSPIQKFHVENRSAVCVIGFEIAERLFQRINPIGQALQVAVDSASFSCVVIGVAKPTFSKERRFRPDLEVTVPYTYYMALPLGWYRRSLWDLVIQVAPDADIELVGKKIQAFFSNRYGKSGRFQAASNTVLVAQMKRFLTLFTILLGCIAAVTLVVGGMGITNMMLVAVNERLREIGLRKALGASHEAIRQLFFAESLMLCLAAGVVGLISGFAIYQGLIYAASRFIDNLNFEWLVNPLAMVIAFAAIIVTGILSGLGPALKAERLQVIEALRAE